MCALTLDRNRCIRCGACVSACVRTVLDKDAEGVPYMLPEHEGRCILCGHCGAICPVDAIVPPGYGGELAMPLDSDAPADFASARRSMLSCRSIRQYREEPVPKETILELLDVARRAPSASNLQPVRWMVLHGREKTERFTALTMDWFDTVVRHDPAMKRRYNVDDMMARYRDGHDPILRGALNAVCALTDTSAVWGQTDSVIAMTYFCLAAHAGNIGSCWCGLGIMAIRNYAPLREFLRLGEEDCVNALAFFGRSDMTYHALPPRKPLRLAWI